MAYYKFPSIKHFPFSEHVTTDDKVMNMKDVLRNFEGKEVVVTEKLDGENSTLYRDYYHARSVSGNDHPSRHWLKSLWGTIRNQIPEGWRIVGENVYAEHSIHYLNLHTYFYVISVWDDKNKCLSWDDTVDFAQNLGLKVVPLLWGGKWNIDKVKSCFTNKSVFEGSYDIKTKQEAQEGYVCRISGSFEFPVSKDNEKTYFSTIAKFVRKNHVQTSDHWLTKQVVPNNLRA